jgi:hypothetical protein
VNVDTGSFRALTDQVAALEADVARIRHGLGLGQALLDAVAARAYRDGIASILGSRPERRAPGPRHLQVVDGGAS